MEEKYSTDWWLWQMYRQVAEYVNDPTDVNETRLKSLLSQYRNYRDQPSPDNSDGDLSLDFS